MGAMHIQLEFMLDMSEDRYILHTMLQEPLESKREARMRIAQDGELRAMLREIMLNPKK